MKPYYDDGQVVIYHGDAREVLPSIGGGSVACMVTSPPYNVGIDYDGHDDSMPWEDYWRLAADVTAAAVGVMADGSRAWVNTGVGVPLDGKGQTGWHSESTHKRRVLLNVRWALVMEAAGLHLIDQIAWVSQRGSGTAWGSYESPASPNIRGDWESITIGCKGTWPRATPDEHHGWKDSEGGWAPLTSTVWKIQPAARKGHPVPFPVELAARCVRLSTWPGEVVLDPFMGAGASLVAAKTLGRRAVGIDLSERYCEEAARRCAQGVLDLDAA